MKNKITYPAREFWADWERLDELTRSLAPGANPVPPTKLFFREKYGRGAGAPDQYKIFRCVLEYVIIFSALFAEETPDGNLYYPPATVERILGHAVKNRIFSTRRMPPGCYFARGNN